MAMNRAAVVVNPTKHANRDEFRAMVAAAMAGHGWSEPLWLETTADETGEGLARTAVQSGVDLVLASGGDGTVTACATGRLARIAFRELRLDLERPHPWELDGEVMGSTRQLVVTVEAGALLLRVPATPLPGVPQNGAAAG
jgi:diacylglycerol kinase family enzyme